MNGAVRALELPAGTSSIANALARLDDWIETADGGWVQKSHVVEARNAEAAAISGVGIEYEALHTAARAIADQAGQSVHPDESASRPLLSNLRRKPGKDHDGKHVEATDDRGKAGTGTTPSRASSGQGRAKGRP